MPAEPEVGWATTFLKSCLHVGASLRVGLAEVPLRRVGGEDVPLRRAGAERIGRDHLDAGLDQVVPALDVLRVVVAHRECDDRVRDDPVVGLLVPVLVHEPCVDEDLNVTGPRGKDDVARLAGGNGLRLARRGAVGLRERHALALRRGLEGRDQRRHDRLRRRVGDEIQRRARRCARSRAAAACRPGPAILLRRRRGGAGRTVEVWLFSSSELIWGVFLSARRKRRHPISTLVNRGGE